MEEDSQVAKPPQDQKELAESSEESILRDLFKEWPELKDQKVEEAERKIKEAMPEAEIKVVHFPIPHKFRHDCMLETHRVWFFVDDSGFVRVTPYTR